MSMPDKILAKKMKKKELKKKKMLLEKQAKEAEVLGDSNEADDDDVSDSVSPAVVPVTASKHKLEETVEDSPVKKKKKKKDKLENGDAGTEKKPKDGPIYDD